MHNIAKKGSLKATCVCISSRIFKEAHSRCKKSENISSMLSVRTIICFYFVSNAHWPSVIAASRVCIYKKPIFTSCEINYYRVY